MSKKITSWLTLIAFLLFSFGCPIHTIKKERVETPEAWRGKPVQVLALMTKSGQHIEFPKDKPGYIRGQRIVGEILPVSKTEKIEVYRTQIQDISRDRTGDIIKVILKDGRTYLPIRGTIQEERTKLVFDTVVYERTALGLQRVELLKNDVKTVQKDSKGTILKIIDNQEQTYVPVETPVQELSDKYVFKTKPSSVFTSVSIPLTDVELVWVKKVDPGMVFVATIGVIGIVLTGLLLIAIATKESCPFIYSFNGKEYVFDAEPYGGAICQGLKRTDWCGLSHLKEIDGLYKIRITNEVNETQYTDEVKLLVVDHPKGTKAVPDIFGRIHTISQPVPPILAHDAHGRNLLSYVAENDWIYWQTRIEEKDPDRIEDLKDELIFEFPKPDGAEQAKLLFNGCTTLWGSQMLKRFLEFHGERVSAWYEEMNRFGPAFSRVMNLNLREELYSLHIRVETPQGWKSKGMLFGGGPFVSEDKVYRLDLRDVPGSQLRIKLTPPAAYWMINYLAVDYTEDLLVTLNEVGAVSAVDYRGRDIREFLSRTDNNYLVMPLIGDRADLSFPAPPLADGLARTVLAKVCGYYDIHLEADGEPRWHIIDRFFEEPGFAVQYAFREYLKWREANQKKLLK